MAVYLVTWELNSEKPNYNLARERFLSRLARYDHIKDPGLDSVVFLSSAGTAQQVSDDLRQALDDNDRLVITKMNAGQYAGWLQQSVWKWINDRV